MVRLEFPAMQDFIWFQYYSPQCIILSCYVTIPHNTGSQMDILQFPTVQDFREKQARALSKREYLKLAPAEKLLLIPHYAGFKISLRGLVIILPHNPIYFKTIFLLTQWGSAGLLDFEEYECFRMKSKVKNRCRGWFFI